MKNILIAGATGNIGKEVIRYLFDYKTGNHIIAGVRDIEKAKAILSNYPQLGYVKFDFEFKETFPTALIGIDSVFLLRPPHISDVNKYIEPFISQLRVSKVKQILFLSVQGVETSRVIPHHKIEDLIVASGLEYIFLRPSYFMQNLTTTLLSDIRNRREIILPAGHAKFNWVDIENIGEVSATLLDKFDEHKNRAMEITGYENENFDSVVKQINEVVANKIRFVNVNPFRYYAMKRREGITRGLVFVTLLLHFLPRFQKEPRISDFYEKLTGKKPTTLKSFIEREKAILES
jgi:uncharacterized protein YbjT (DUF2867 family)